MARMTERGLPTVDSALACPFVAFEDDRDSRATSPDHRHRCYAEVRPAPRALAHQQAYCLSSAFAVCPTFQDWARREAAQARSDAAAAADSGGVTRPDEAPRPVDDPVPQRNPPRDWTSPPPWMSSTSRSDDDDSLDDEPDVLPIPARGGGLAGSFADRVAGGGRPPMPDAPDEPPARQAPRPPDRDVAVGGPSVHEADLDLDDDDAPEPGRPAAASGQGSQVRPRRPASRAAGDRAAPSWERLPRREAYPTLKTRMGLSGVSVPPLLLGVVALVIAAIALFTLPALLGIGNPAASPTPNASVVPSGASASQTPFVPTAVPEPTAQVYVVQGGDTMSKIANRFGVPLQVLCDTNKATIPNCDKVNVGQEVIIPVIAPTTVPDAGSSPSAAP